MKVTQTDLSKENPSDRAEVTVSKRTKVSWLHRMKIIGIFTVETKGELETFDQHANALIDMAQTAIVLFLAIVACLGTLVTAASFTLPWWVTLLMEALILAAMGALLLWSKGVRNRR